MNQDGGPTKDYSRAIERQSKFLQGRIVAKRLAFQCWPTVGNMSGACRLTVGRLLADSRLRGAVPHDHQSVATDEQESWENPWNKN